MNKPKVTEHNCETGEVIEREMTDAEFNQYKIDQKVFDEMAKKEEEAKLKKAALLEKLGITEDEAKLLLA